MANADPITRQGQTAVDQSAEAADTFDLIITFGGLCTLVDDPHAPGGRPLLHVLMPRTEHHPHMPCILYNPGYLDGSEEVCEPAGFLELTNRKFDLTSLDANDRLKTNLRQSNVFDLGTLVNRTVGRHLLDMGDHDTKPNQSVSRVSVAKGKVVLRKKGAIWKMDGVDPEHMAITVQWRIKKVKGTSLTLDLQPLNEDGSEDDTVTLVPINGIIKFYVYHSPDRELPKIVPPPDDPDAQLEPGTRAEHFMEFYPLLDMAPLPLVPVAEATTSESGVNTPPPETLSEDLDGALGEHPCPGGLHDTLHTAEEGNEEEQVPQRALLASVGEEMTCMLTRAEAVKP